MRGDIVALRSQMQSPTFLNSYESMPSRTFGTLGLDSTETAVNAADRFEVKYFLVQQVGFELVAWVHLIDTNTDESHFMFYGGYDCYQGNDNFELVERRVSYTRRD